MLTLILICLIAGIVGGLLQGTIGVGTGIIVVPLLTFLLPLYGIPNDVSIHAALATAMATIVVTSIASLISHHKQENIQWHIFFRIILFSIAGSLIGAIAVGYLPANVLKTVFAIFMFYVAIKMTLPKKKHASHAQEKLSPKISQSVLACGGTITGMVASLIGAGGSILMVPFLHSRKLEMRYAVGTATLIGLPVAITGTMTYILMGMQQTQHVSMMLGYLYWPAFLSISVTGVIFAYIGAIFVKKMPVLLMQRLFALCAVMVGIKMII